MIYRDGHGRPRAADSVNARGVYARAPLFSDVVFMQTNNENFFLTSARIWYILIERLKRRNMSVCAKTRADIWR